MKRVYLKKKMKEQIINHILEGILREDHHFDYCSYPFEDCCCIEPEINDNTQLLAKGYLDSLNLVVLVKYVEDEFDIKIDDSDITPANFETVKDARLRVDGN